MLAARALVAVGAVEGVSALYLFIFPVASLSVILGRILSVGADQSPGLRYTLAQAAALRLVLAAMLIIVGLTVNEPSPVQLTISCATFHTGLLQPYIAVFRAHRKMPVNGRIALSLAEAVGLVVSFAADYGFASEPLGQFPAFGFSVLFTAAGLVMAVGGTLCKCWTPDATDEEVGLQDTPAAGMSASLFDPSRHSLSPASRRLLQ